MRLTVVSCLVIAIGALAVFTPPVCATQRAGLLSLSWGRTIPDAEEAAARRESPKPLLVYIESTKESRNQDRMDEVVLANESFLLAAKFFTCVRIDEEDAKEHPLLAKLRISAPVMVVFDSTRSTHTVVGGTSAMKIYGALCKLGQRDYGTSISGTVRAARNLLGSFDRIDAAQGALGIKMERLSKARGKGNAAKIRQLEKEVEKDQAAIASLSEKTRKRWSEIWDVKRKKREPAASEDAE